jgi:hypothetical protein
MAFSIQDYLEHNKIELGKITKEVGDTPYKGGHNDIRKTNYDVKIKEDGKLDLYTHKKVLTESILNEASEVSFNELKPEQQKQIKAFEQLLGGKVNSIFDGIHGFIVDLKVSGGHGNYRFEADEMKKLISLKVRWVEGDRDNVSIGF